MDLLLRDLRATDVFGRTLGRLLLPGQVVGLIGEPGAGKTTLTRSIGEGLGVVDAVTSPTFALIQEYRGPIPLFHMDPYRLDRPEDLLDQGFEEYLERGGVVVVEWADRLGAYLPQDRLMLTLTPVDDEENAPRLLQVQAFGARSETLMAGLLMEPEVRTLRAVTPSA
jgi:tRNA threonylcarbamoyladenosine biosynthesis protein TsaE